MKPKENVISHLEWIEKQREMINDVKPLKLSRSVLNITPLDKNYLRMATISDRLDPFVKQVTLQALDDYEIVVRRGLLMYGMGEFLKLLPPIETPYKYKKGDCPNHIVVDKRLRNC